MKARAVGYLVGVMTACVGGMLLVPLLFSAIFGDGAVEGTAWALGASVGAGGLLAVLCRDKKRILFSRSAALASVGLCWVVAGSVGALPYVLTGLLGPVDAFFESVSGFTTTGATMITNVEIVPRGLLLWRSMTQWLGGMGIIVLSLAVLPHLGVGGMQLYSAEVPGPTHDKLTPRIQDTAKALWAVYGVLTLVMTVCLCGAGMDLFDAVNHSLTTMATGGFSTRNASLAAYSPACQWVVILFMMAAGVNFTLHCRFVLGERGVYLRNDECRAFLGITACCSLVIAFLVWWGGAWRIGGLADVEHLLRAALFQVASLATSTGFASENYALWPLATIPVFFLVMFAGGCAGSTGGGFKIMRVVILGRALYLHFFQILHPHAVRPVKMQGRVLSEGVLGGVIGFLLVFLSVLSLATFVVMLYGIDLLTAFSAALTRLSNVGPGFGRLGPVDNFFWLPAAVKMVLSFVMLLGRLEFYALLIVFVPEFWRR